MKKQYTLPTILFICISFLTCRKVEKNVYDYYPRVETVGAIIQPDGSIKVTGKIQSAGRGELYFIGFALDTLSNPGMLNNQKLTDTLFSDNTFSTTYSNLNSAKKYFVRAWAVNEYGYSYGNDIQIQDIKVAIPCEPPFNTLMFADNNESEPYIGTSTIEQYTTGWTIRTSTNSRMVQFIFGQYPVSGVYKTTESSSIDKEYVSILINGYTIDNGADVYVQQISKDTLEVTICEANLYSNGSNRKISTRLRAYGI